MTEIEAQSGLDFRIECPDLADAVSRQASKSPKPLPPGPEVPGCLLPSIRPASLAQESNVVGGCPTPSDIITVEGPGGIYFAQNNNLDV